MDESQNIELTTPVEEQIFPEFSSLIPNDFKENKMLGEIPDVPTAIKMLVDQNVALSKRPAGIPQDNATDQEWSDYATARGVPENGEGYAFAELPEGQERNEAFDKGIRELFKAADIDPRQAAKLDSGFSELMGSMSEAMKAESEKSDVDFDKLGQDTFGDNMDQVMKTAKGLLAQHTPENMKGHLDTLSNENLIIMAGVLNNFAKEYISEDKLPGDGAGQVSFGSEAEKQAEGIKLMTSPAYQDAFHPNHKDVVDKVQKLFGNYQG